MTPTTPPDWEKQVRDVLDQARLANGKKPLRKDGKPEGIFLRRAIQKARSEEYRAPQRILTRPLGSKEPWTYEGLSVSKAEALRNYRQVADEEDVRARRERFEAFERDSRTIDQNLEGFASSGSRGIQDVKTRLPWHRG